MNEAEVTQEERERRSGWDGSIYDTPAWRAVLGVRTRRQWYVGTRGDGGQDIVSTEAQKKVLAAHNPDWTWKVLKLGTI